ncbi:vegetative incompatibility protein het-e-1 [Colletotrichum chrysophilum]|uniref:Vegetative incompatibility protein het-e-1 n=1 Tax=Colletotrichum chrysophilum TaxID=1836956 RepID=A0AAD9A6L0_9PEZI|nr:vegetative incompatibility protein het-e-1 [Colletotrichum chrysophilum]
MLLCGIIDELNEENSGHQPIYFFCQATDSDLSSASAILRGILYLLLKRKPQLVKDLRETYDYCDRRLFESRNGWETLCDMIISVLANESFQNAVIVIDALDECITGVDRLLDFIHLLSSKAVRVIVSSRNWPTIERGIAAAAQKAAHVSLELNEQSVSAAVVAFIEHKVNQLAQKHEYSAAKRDLVHSTLVKNSHSTFLWAALVCQQLADNNTNDWEVESKLAEFPPGLDVLYTRMLHHALSSNDVQLIRRILAVASVVFRPVDIAEMRSLLGPLGTLVNDARSLEKAVRQCGSFLTIRNNTVYFVHQSAKDFLLDHPANEKVMLGGSNCEHGLIWMHSLQVMSTTLLRNIYLLDTPGTFIGDVRTPIPDPLAPVRYSCIHWINHFCTASCIEQHQIGHMEYFFAHCFLHWIEAICLMGSVYEGVESMKKLSSALKVCTARFSKLTSLVEDALRFLQQYRYVIEKAPLQIYLSVLLFSPRTSLARRLYLREVPVWIAIKPLVKEEDWDTCIQVFGHHDQCQTLMFSPEGNFLASTSLDDMKLWDAKTGQCLRTIRPSNGRLGQVKFFCDGLIVAAVVGNFQCNLWSVKTGCCLHTLQYHSGKINSIALSPNGRNLVMGSEDTIVTLWNIETGKCLLTLNGHSSPAVAVAFSPDGCTFASAAAPIKIWHTETGDCLQNMQPNVNFRLASILYTPEGCQIRSISWKRRDASRVRETRIGLWEISTGQCLTEIKIPATDFVESGAEGTSFSLSPHNGGIIASQSSEKTIKAWLLRTGKLLTETLHPYRIAGLSISSDGEHIAIVSDQGTVRFQQRTNLRHQKKGHEILFLHPPQYTGSDMTDSFYGRGVLSTGPVQSVNFSIDGQKAISVRQGQLIVDV